METQVSLGLKRKCLFKISLNFTKSFAETFAKISNPKHLAGNAENAGRTAKTRQLLKMAENG
jgi:hypothetical protein